MDVEDPLFLRWAGYLEGSLPTYLGRGRSLYRGARYLQEGTGEVLARAGWDGSLEVPARMVEEVARVQKRPALVREPGVANQHVRDVATVLHEGFHHLVPERGYDVVAAQQAYARWAGTVLEEGVTEAATVRSLPAYVLELDKQAPGLARGLRGYRPSYPNLVPAVQWVAGRIQALPPMRERDVLGELAVTGAEGKLAALTRLATEGLGLDRVLGAVSRADCRRRMSYELVRLFESPENVAWAKPKDPRRPARLDTRDAYGRSTIMGMQAWALLRWEGELAKERAGVPMDQNWRVVMAKEVRLMAAKAVDFASDRQPETQSAAAEWLARVRRDGLATTGPSVPREPQIGTRGAPSRVPYRSWSRERRGRELAR